MESRSAIEERKQKEEKGQWCTIFILERLRRAQKSESLILVGEDEQIGPHHHSYPTLPSSQPVLYPCDGASYFPMVSDTLKTDTKIQKFSFYMMNLAHAKGIAESLKQNATLNSLDLSAKESGAFAIIAKALQNNKTVQALWAQGNLDLGDVEALIKLHDCNPNLKISIRPDSIVKDKKALDKLDVEEQKKDPQFKVFMGNVYPERLDAFFLNKLSLNNNNQKKRKAEENNEAIYLHTRSKTRKTT